MSGVARQEQAPALHRLDDNASHRRDSEVEDLPRAQVGLAQSDPQLGPDPLLRPALQLLVGCHLEVKAADLRRPHAVERKAMVVVCVDELVAGRRRTGEDT